MNDDTSATARRVTRGVVVVLVGLLAAGLLARLALVWRTNINWDEFYYLSKVHSYARGELSGRLLTFHVHLFGWVLRLWRSEVDQVLVIRVVYLVAGAVTAGALVVVVRALVGSVVAGLAAAVCVQGFSLVLQFGTSARFDPSIVLCFMAAMAVLTLERRRADVAAGALLGLGLLLSVKTAFYAPTVAFMLLARRDKVGWRTVVADTAVVAGAVAVVVGVFGGLHALSLAKAPSQAALMAAEGGGLREIATKVLQDLWSFPQEGTLDQSLSWDWFFWRAIGIGIVFCVFNVVGLTGPSRQRRLHALAAASFALPLVTLTFYRNAYPYFYVSIIPPAAVVVGAAVAGVERAISRVSAVGLVAPIIASALVVVPAVRQSVKWIYFNHRDEVSHQRDVLDAVHQVFSTPVAYLDRCSMVGAHRKVGPFMSTWVIDTYRERGVPVYRGLLHQEAPHYLLANVSALDLRRADETLQEATHALLDDDIAVLRSSFIQHWGPLWVSGKAIDAAPDGADVVFDIAADYRVSAAVAVDGAEHAAGDVVRVDVGVHRVVAADDVEFRVADAGPPPSRSPPTRAVFSRFRYRPFPAANKAAP